MKLVNQLEEDFENLLVVIKVQLVLFALGKHDYAISLCHGLSGTFSGCSVQWVSQMLKQFPCKLAKQKTCMKNGVF